jgi:hypothetical protein
MLKRLVHPDCVSEPAQVSRLRLAHRGVDRVRGAAGQWLAPARVGQLEFSAKVEGGRESHICFQRADHASLSRVDCRKAHVCHSRHVADRRTATATFLANGPAENDRDSRHFSRDSRISTPLRATGCAFRVSYRRRIVQMFG